MSDNKDISIDVMEIEAIGKKKVVLKGGHPQMDEDRFKQLISKHENFLIDVYEIDQNYGGTDKYWKLGELISNSEGVDIDSELRDNIDMDMISKGYFDWAKALYEVFNFQEYGEEPWIYLGQMSTRARSNEDTRDAYMNLKEHGEKLREPLARTWPKLPPDASIIEISEIVISEDLANEKTSIEKLFIMEHGRPPNDDEIEKLKEAIEKGEI